jgi:hypothetical protein
VQNEISSLLRRINDDPDKLHGDSTPAVERLIDLGEPALAPVLELMLASDSDTRLRAQRVLEGVTMASQGFRRGQGWLETEGEERWRRFWASLGNLDWRAPAERRAEAVARWHAYLVKGELP